MIQLKSARLFSLMFCAAVAAVCPPAAHGQSPTSFRILDSQDLFQPALEECDLLAIDTLLYVENRGLDRILFDVNGHRFRLVTSEEERERSVNAFLIPLNGEITYHIGALIKETDDNCVAISVRGAPGADADIIIGDLMIPGQTIAGTIRDLEPLPASFDLQQAYPNPFVDRTTISFSIPERLSDGAVIEVNIVDVMGRRIRRLEDGRFFPGEFRVEWDGRDQHGAAVSPGVYIYHLRAIEFESAGKVVKLR